jgi:hypothetical protein
MVEWYAARLSDFVTAGIVRTNGDLYRADISRNRVAANHDRIIEKQPATSTLRKLP